jgi:hypothetical protein
MPKNATHAPKCDFPPTASKVREARRHAFPRVAEPVRRPERPCDPPGFCGRARRPRAVRALGRIPRRPTPGDDPARGATVPERRASILRGVTRVTRMSLHGTRGREGGTIMNEAEESGGTAIRGEDADGFPGVGPGPGERDAAGAPSTWSAAGVHPLWDSGGNPRARKRRSGVPPGPRTRDLRSRSAPPAGGARPAAGESVPPGSARIACRTALRPDRVRLTGDDKMSIEAPAGS